jgi:hypothetical protein
MQVIFTQIAGGAREYWTDCDGQRYYITEACARRLISQGGRLVDCNAY